MRLDVLEITNFRNLKSSEIRFGPKVNVFSGNNGSGKTNLLEAIFNLCLGRSQRGARDIMLIGDTDQDFYRLEGAGRTAGGEIRLTCACQRGGRKKITVDDNPARISQLFQIFSLISMAPEDVALLAGAPQKRRRFLDLHLSQASPSYLSDLSDYNKALAQKNAFLKNYSGDECPFDVLLADYGSRIMEARKSFLEFLQDRAPGYYSRICGLPMSEKVQYSFDYKPNVTFYQEEEIRDNFMKKLRDYREKEKIMEMAIVGPHRDDIEFHINRFPARGFGSQGELRSAAVAIMMAAADFLANRRQEKPILLLDEIFAELDTDHRDNLAGLLEDFEQTFLTSAVNPPPRLSQQGRHFIISEGRIREE